MKSLNRLLFFFRMKSRDANDEEKKRRYTFMGVLIGLLAVVAGVFGIKYGIAAIIAGITAIGVGLGLKKD